MPRLSAPAAARNISPIRDVLRGILPRSGLVLEVASGSGEHALWLAAAFPDLDWQPSDIDPEALASISAWRTDHDGTNLRAPVRLDAATPPWLVTAADAVLCTNMVHISPWKCTEGLVRGAAEILSADGPLVLYGPFSRAGVHTAASNAAFDRSLRARDPGWGVRDLDDVAALAGAAGFATPSVVEMPANNLVVVFRRAQGGR